MSIINDSGLADKQSCAKVRSAQEILADSAALVFPAICDAIVELPTNIKKVVEYHFGWDDGVAAKGYNGKSARAALAILSCEALGVAASHAINAATCVELLHNASLLHDDIIDHDRQRRGRPTAWAVFGVPAALLAGDALFFLAIRRAADLTTDEHASIALVVRAVGEVIEGEYIDTLLEGRTAVPLIEVENMAAGKTGALIALACRLGGLAAGADSVQQQHLAGFGHHLGIAFQYIDDVLGLWGDSVRTGKPVGADLRTRKLSLPIAYALGTGTAAASRLSAVYRRSDPLSDAECGEALAMMEEVGARSWAIACAEKHAALSLNHLQDLDAQPGPVTELETLTRLLLDRNY